MAILREQGINGQIEMAAAFDAAGFQSVDVTMTDLIEARTDLGDFSGMVACGGFSYGDVLGAGAGWARSILYNPKLRLQFTKFFNRQDSFTLGVCNGCQMLSRLKDLIPGAENWPKFLTNRSEQFEARLSTVEIIDSLIDTLSVSFNTSAVYHVFYSFTLESTSGIPCTYSTDTLIEIGVDSRLNLDSIVCVGQSFNVLADV